MITDYSNRIGDDPRLFDPVRVKVLRPFYNRGKRIEVGAVVELQRHDARSLAAIGKVQLLKE